MSTDVDVGALVLTVDLGSTGLKVGYVTLAGSPVWWHQETLVTHCRGGAATQDATDWWDRITGAARRGLVEAGLDGRRVVGVGITGQWGSTVPAAADGTPVGEVVMWNDARGVEHSRAAVGGPVVEDAQARPLPEEWFAELFAVGHRIMVADRIRHGRGCPWKVS